MNKSFITSGPDQSHAEIALFAYGGKYSCDANKMFKNGVFVIFQLLIPMTVFAFWRWWLRAK